MLALGLLPFWLCNGYADGSLRIPANSSLHQEGRLVMDAMLWDDVDKWLSASLSTLRGSNHFDATHLKFTFRMGLITKKDYIFQTSEMGIPR
ncbi:Uncharacterised protein [uncultured archaeon]|nr:Uncharacterised protein [uncultured archaeon]